MRASSTLFHVSLCRAISSIDAVDFNAGRARFWGHRPLIVSRVQPGAGKVFW